MAATSPGPTFLRRHARRSSPRPRRCAGVSGSSAPPVLPPQGGLRDRPHHIGGMPGQRHSEPPRGHVARLPAPDESDGSLCLGRYCRGDRSGANKLEQRGFDRVIDPQPAKSDAARLAVVEEAAMAGVARNIVLRAGVADRQLAPAAATADKTGEQGVAVLGRTMMLTCRDVLAYHPDRL